jgi:hypothetical protein
MSARHILERARSRALGQRSSEADRGPHDNGRRDEAGAVLILALVFLVAVSLIVTGLLTFVGTSLSATTSFSSERLTENSASSAVNLAIQNTRATFVSGMTNASPPVACWYNNGVAQQPPPLPNDPGDQIDVWCSMVWQPYNSATRIITYSACAAARTSDPATCAENPLLQAVVTFDDYEPGLVVPGVVQPGQAPANCTQSGLCGQTLTQNSWQWNPQVPVVSSISPTTNTIAGNVCLTITGTNFVNGSTVNFVEESGASGTPANAPVTDNTVITLPTSQVPWSGNCAGGNNSATSISVLTPAVIEGTDYFVTVTSPGGTSAYAPTPGSTIYNDLHYTTFQPTVSGITGPNVTGGIPQGTLTGGSSITITGTGFFQTSNFPLQVWFWQSGVKQAAQNVSVNSGTNITASSPPVTTTGTWYVQVQTSGGTSSNSTDFFNYSAQVPLVISLNPTSGGPSSRPAVSSLVITGANFLTGANATTVGFCLTSNWSAANNTCSNTIGAANPTVTSSSALTVTIPTGNNGLVRGSTYYPLVTTSVGGNSYTSQAYNLPADIFTYTG